MRKKRPEPYTREQAFDELLHDELLEELEEQTKELRKMNRNMEKLIDLLTPKTETASVAAHNLPEKLKVNNQKITNAGSKLDLKNEVRATFDKK